MYGKTKGTIRMMDPNIFVAYILVVDKNIKPERIFTLWANHDGYPSSGHWQILELINDNLQKFWHAVGLKQLSKGKEVVAFLNRYRNVVFIKRFWYKIKSL